MNSSNTRANQDERPDPEIPLSPRQSFSLPDHGGRNLEFVIVREHGEYWTEDEGFASFIPEGLPRNPDLEFRIEDSKPPFRREPYVPVPFILIKGEDGEDAGLWKIIIVLATVVSFELTRSFSCWTLPASSSWPLIRSFRICRSVFYP
jgi:hypothetical protein